MSRIMFACIVMHNMIIEDERDMDEEQCHYEYDCAGQMSELFRDVMFL